jgi:hypothetical protein
VSDYTAWLIHEASQGNQEAVQAIQARETAQRWRDSKIAAQRAGRGIRTRGEGILDRLRDLVLVLPAVPAPDVADLAITSAAQSADGQPITLLGSKAYKQAIFAAAIRTRARVVFADPALEADRAMQVKASYDVEASNLQTINARAQYRSRNSESYLSALIDAGFVKTGSKSVVNNWTVAAYDCCRENRIESILLIMDYAETKTYLMTQEQKDDLYNSIKKQQNTDRYLSDATRLVRSNYYDIKALRDAGLVDPEHDYGNYVNYKWSKKGMDIISTGDFTIIHNLLSKARETEQQKLKQEQDRKRTRKKGMKR